MNIAGTWKFRRSWRPLLLFTTLFGVLAVSTYWNLRQHRLIEQNRIARQREEAARAAEEAKMAELRQKTNTRSAVAGARLKQLYQEINNLSEISERFLSQPEQPRLTTTNDVDETASTP